MIYSYIVVSTGALVLESSLLISLTHNIYNLIPITTTYKTIKAKILIIGKTTIAKINDPINYKTFTIDPYKVKGKLESKSS